MKIIKPSYELMSEIDGESILRHLEKAIRTCYKSEDKINDDSHFNIVKHIMNLNHVSTLEHFSFTVRFICNRGFSHEMVRHRLASFSQESTRYCNYSKDKFDGNITFIKPTDYSSWTPHMRHTWEQAMTYAEASYMDLIEAGAKAGEARGVLPIDVKTEIVVTANLREWHHIFSLRTANPAHRSMQELMRPLCDEMKSKIPIIFDDIKYEPVYKMEG